MMKEKSDKTNRRAFIKNMASAAVGAAFITGQSKAEPNKPTTTAKTQDPVYPQVPKRLLGKTGIEIPCLALGTIFDVLENQIVLQKAFAIGVTCWDTAPDYAGPNSELGIGKFITDNPKARKQLFLVTKASDTITVADVEDSLQASLKRMNTKYIDLYHIMDHIKAPSFGGHGLSDPSVLSDELKQWVQSAKKRRLIRFFGFSTHKNMPACLNAAAKLGWIDAAMLVYNFRQIENAELQAAIDACNKAGVGLIAMKTQAHWPKGESETPLTRHFIERGFTAGQAKLKAVLQDKRFSCACAGMPNVALLETNAAAVLDKTELSQHDLDIFTQYAQQSCSGYCLGCSDICNGVLPDTPCISEVIRYLTYYNSYGQTARARRLFAKIPAGIRSRLLSTDYTIAQARCPHHLPIKELVAEAVGKLA
ncbi:MAG TPA: aldo/keto reductase [Sedimentisphaerales bacterium]|nr:aldo/keto reductase [Sedimentisphaerales bacterium]